MTTVLIVDDHEIARTGIRAVLQSIPKLTVIGEVANGLEAIQFVKKNNTDIIFMDIQMPGIDGLETTRRIHLYNPEIKIIIISCFIADPYPVRLLEVGASGYVAKNDPAKEIVKALKSVLLGKNYVSPTISQQLAVNKIGQHASVSFDVLSLRETQIALMLIAGKSVQEIADIFYISHKTIRAHRYQIFKKLKVENDVSLILLAKKLGYFTDFG